MNEIILVLKYKLLWLMALLAAAFTALSFLHPGFIPFALIFALGIFDQIGYGIVVQRKNLKTDETHEPEKIHEAAYHIIGFIVNLIALSLTWLLENHINGSAVAWNCVIPFVIFFWFGGKDQLYYWGLKEEMSETMYWFYWTPLGIFFTIIETFKYKSLRFSWEVFITHKSKVFLNKKEVNIQAIIGSVLTAAYIIYFFIGVIL